MRVIQIALVDDHRLFRSGMAALIGGFLNYNILFEAGNGDELIGKLTPELLPHIILLDINMPKKDGLATAKWLQEKFPDVKVIILSMFGDAETVLQMIKFGIKGYLLKDAEPSEFENALDRVSRGETYFPPFVIRHLTENSDERGEKFKLSPRELTFLKLMANEYTNKEIAVKLKVSVRTVDGYRDQLFNKLNVKNRIGLMRYAIKNKLIDL